MLPRDSQDTGRVQQNSPAQLGQNSGRGQKQGHQICDTCNKIFARVAMRDRGTGSELLAIPAATEKVLVPYELVIPQQGAEADDSQDALENKSRRILATTCL